MPEKPSYEELEKRIIQLEAEQNRHAQLEVELKRSLRFTESLLTAIPTPIFFKDAQGRYQGCNPAFTEIMGVTPQQIRGKKVQELWPSEHADVYHQKDIELINKQTHQVYEFEIKDKNGTIRPVVFYKNVFYDENAKVAGIVGGFVDISERKQNETELKESENRYRLLADNVSDNIWIFDLETLKFSYVSPSVIGITGFTSEEATGFQLEDTLTPPVFRTCQPSAHGRTNCSKSTLRPSKDAYA